MRNRISKSSLSSMMAGIKKIPWTLGKRAFSVFLLLIVLDVIFGLAIFYYYVLLIKTSAPQAAESPSTFKSDTYQEILKDWEARDQKLQDNNFQNSF